MTSEINNLSSTNLQSIKQFSNNSSKKAVQAEIDNDKSKAMAYMVGATAVATVIAVGILSKKGRLGTKMQEALWGGTSRSSINPSTSSTVDNLLSTDKKAKLALKDLYQMIIDKANKSGNDKRANIFEQCKNNIDNLDTSTTYGNLLDTLYKESRLSEYATSNLITKDIEKITAQSTPSIRVKNASGWHYRIPKSRQGKETVDRISVNAFADENLIKELDELFASGKVKGYYKTPDQALNWLERHDPITIYLDEVADKTTLDNVKSVCQKYIRSTDDALLGDKFAPGMALQKSPNKQDIETILSQAKNIDPQLENVLRKQFTELSTGELKTSAGYIDAAKNLMDLVK